jgi:hypothetical protein|tara:strand:+ start:903 stop:1271 length:369 start_codon:yes stop_codon:yes gene_type:complete
MPIDKSLTYVDLFYGKPRVKRVSPKVAKVITQRLELSGGGSTNEKPKPKPPSNVIPFVPRPDSPYSPENPDGWTKRDFVTDAKADIEFYREQLFKIYGGGVMKFKKSELKELLQYHLDHGGI